MVRVHVQTNDAHHNAFSIHITPYDNICLIRRIALSY